MNKKRCFNCKWFGDNEDGLPVGYQILSECRNKRLDFMVKAYNEIHNFFWVKPEFGCILFERKT